MKIPGSVRVLYDDQCGVNNRLKIAVDKRINAMRDSRWHYESRVKELPSFALKLESGRIPDPKSLEDFFACTIVVANALEIDRAETIICDSFEVLRRKPLETAHTHKSSDAFPFDDLRLYVRLPSGPSVPPSDLGGVIFEIQIKTFLQHAWSIATHDLVYKSDDVNWSKERIAYQIKAMLEHAEVSIQEAERLAASSVLAKQNTETETLKRAITLIKAQWASDELPQDIRRLSVNISAVIKAMDIGLDRLEEILIAGKAGRGGHHPANLSPYCTVVQYLIGAEQAKMFQYLRKERARQKILIPDEVELPEGTDRGSLRNAVFVKAS